MYKYPFQTYLSGFAEELLQRACTRRRRRSRFSASSFASFAGSSRVDAADGSVCRFALFRVADNIKSEVKCSGWLVAGGACDAGDDATEVTYHNKQVVCIMNKMQWCKWHLTKLTEKPCFRDGNKASSTRPRQVEMAWARWLHIPRDMLRAAPCAISPIKLKRVHWNWSWWAL